MQSERQAFLAAQEVQSWKSLYEKEKEKVNWIKHYPSPYLVVLQVDKNIFIKKNPILALDFSNWG